MQYWCKKWTFKRINMHLRGGSNGDAPVMTAALRLSGRFAIFMSPVVVDSGGADMLQ
jgi:hypothetical protein